MSEPDNVQILSAYDEDGDIDLDFAEAAAKIAKDRDLGITRDRELQYVAMIDDEVVGAAWIAFDGENYEFDIAVARGFGRNGIGRSLVGAVIADREFVCEGREGTTMLVPVTSPAMCRLLEAEGFVITDMPAKGFVTMGPKDECVPYPDHQRGLEQDSYEP